MKINLNQAIELLNNKQIIGIPTETVYGLAARYDQKEAIQKIFKTKERPESNPLIIHIGNSDPLGDLKKLVLDIPAYVPELIKQFWPGPLTMVFYKKPLIDDLITAGQNTVGIRMPQHPLTLELINQLGAALVAPSANKFCKLSPTSAAEVESALGSKIPVLDGGPCSVGIESTIVSVLNHDRLDILRPGMITAETLSQITGLPCHESFKNTQAHQQSSIKTPGAYLVHYAPNKPLFLINSAYQNNPKDFLNFLEKILKKIGPDKKFYYLTFQKKDFLSQENITQIITPQTPTAYAEKLYGLLHQADRSENHQAILIDLPPEKSEWQGIENRLLKAGVLPSGFLSFL